ncbi:MAG TPA: radical SAM protein [Syntrophomonas sp.]|nr:radical SAM protein [Syntrophomonas sp.]HRW11753.1 radical SAM protein [Syntrophomonas sp.]
MRHYNIPIFIPHLGCPYDCIYCDQKKISAQNQAPDEQQVLEIVEQHLATITHPAEIEAAFFGGSFTAIQTDQQEQFLRLLQPYIACNLIQGIRISTRPDCIDEQILARLQRYGVKTIELGVQSMHDEVLRQSGRIYQAEDVEKSCALIKAGGFQLGIQLMVGLPDDNAQRDMETVRRTIALAPQMVRIYPTLVLAGTKLEQMWREGRYQALTLEEAIPICRDMLLQFAKAEIPVIRMGLYPGEELRKPGNIMAGPFHPAFGEQVEQAVFKEQAILAIKFFQQQYGIDQRIVLGVNQRDLSKLLGKKRSNLLAIQRSLHLPEIKVMAEGGEKRDWISVSGEEAGSGQLVFDRMEFLHYLP